MVATYSSSSNGAFSPCHSYAPLVIFEECYKEPKKDPKEIIGKARPPSHPLHPTLFELICMLGVLGMPAPQRELLCTSVWPGHLICILVVLAQPQLHRKASRHALPHPPMSACDTGLTRPLLLLQVADALGSWGKPWGDGSGDVYTPVPSGWQPPPEGWQPPPENYQPPPQNWSPEPWSPPAWESPPMVSFPPPMYSPGWSPEGWSPQGYAPPSEKDIHGEIVKGSIDGIVDKGNVVDGSKEGIVDHGYPQYGNNYGGNVPDSKYYPKGARCSFPQPYVPLPAQGSNLHIPSILGPMQHTGCPFAKLP